MKTAISIPDAIFKRAETFAKANHLSRSELYTRAVARLLNEQPKVALTEAYNDAFGDHGDDPVLTDAARRTLLRVEWDDS